MSKFTTTHELNCSQDKFWTFFLDRSNVSKIYVEAKGYAEYSVLEQNETADTISRKATANPKWTLPGPVQKFMGGDFKYTEESTFDKATKIWRWKGISLTYADKMLIEGNMVVEPIGDNKVRCVQNFALEAKIFGIGGLMESSFEKELRTDADQQAVGLNKIFATG